MRVKELYERNLYLVLFYNWFRYTIFFVPFFTPYLLSHNITYSQIFLIHFVFGATILFLEIPTGYITDRLGRRTALIVSSLIFCGSILFYAQGTLFWHFLVAEVFLGIGYTFFSGTHNAIMYDSLLHLKREKEYKKWLGFSLVAQRSAEIVAAFIAGFLVVYGMTFTFYVTIVPFLLSLPIIFLMKEPEIKKEPIGIGHWHHMGKITKDAYNHPAVFWFSVYAAIISGTMFAAIWLFQTVWTTYDIALGVFGFLWMATQLTSGTGSLVANWVEKKLGFHMSMFCIVLFLFLGLLLSGTLPAPYSVVFMCLCTFLWGFSVPLCNDAINRFVASSRRATVLSFKSMLSRLFHVCFTLIVSFVLVSLSLSLSLVMLGIVYGLVAGYSLYRLYDLGVL